MITMKSGKALLTATMLAGTLVLVGCGGGSDTKTETPPPDPAPSPAEQAQAIVDGVDISAALAADASAAEVNSASMAISDARTAIDGVDGITVAEATAAKAGLDMLEAQLDADDRLAAIAAIATANMMSTADNIAAAETAIAQLASAEQAAFDAQLNAARGTLAADTVDGAIANAKTLVDALTSASTKAQIDAAYGAIMKAEEVIAANPGAGMAGDLAAIKTTFTTTKVAKQTKDITDAIATAQSAVNAIEDDSSDMVVDDAERAIQLAKDTIEAADALSDGEKTAHMNRVDDVEGEFDDAEESLMMARKAKEEADNTLKADTARASEMFAAIAEARDVVSGYDDDAKEALANAAKYSTMLTTVAVKGDSTVAQTNAQMILDALDHMEDAQSNAEASKSMADGYVTEAMGLVDDTPGKAALLKAANDLVGKADSVIADIKEMILEYDRRAYTFGIPENDGGERDPALVAKIVAEAINTILTTDPASTATPPADLAAAPTMVAAVTRPAAAVDPDHPTAAEATALAAYATFKARLQTLPSSAMTWEMIFGSTRVSVAGGKWSEIAFTDDTFATAAAVPAAATINSAFEVPTARYMGIPVNLECDGTCSITGGTLVGDWTVEVDTPTDKWTRTSSGNYAEAVYAEYGHWLDLDTANNNAVRLNLYAGRGDTGTAASGELGTVATLSKKATYNGAAAGMSVRDMNGAAEGGLASGAFTADVELNAIFEAVGDEVAGVSGTIDSFEGGAHVNSAWEVTLESAALGDSAATATTNGRTNTGRNVDQGYWSNAAYGTAGARPTGIYGAFDANFTDGEARGVYVAE